MMKIFLWNKLVVCGFKTSNYKATKLKQTRPQEWTKTFETLQQI